MPGPEKTFDTEQRYRRASAYLEAGEADKALREIALIEAADKIALHQSADRGHSKIALAAVVTLLTLAFAITARMSTTTVNLSIRADGLQLTGKARSKFGFEHLAIESAGARFDELDYFSPSPPIGLAIPGHNLLESKPAALEIKAGKTIIDQLSFDSDSGQVEASLELDGKGLALYVKNASVWGRLSATAADGIALTLDGVPRSTVGDGKAPVRLDRYFGSSRLATSIIPRYYRFTDLQRLDFTVDALHSLNFSREDKRHRTRIQPTAIAGKLHLTDTGTSIEIERGQFLYLECVDCIHNLVHLTDGQIELNLRGKVKNLSGGFESHIDDYMPNLLEFIYHNEKIAMLWAAALFVSGWFLKLRTN